LHSTLDYRSPEAYESSVAQPRVHFIGGRSVSCSGLLDGTRLHHDYGGEQAEHHSREHEPRRDPGPATERPNPEAKRNESEEAIELKPGE